MSGGMASVCRSAPADSARGDCRRDLRRGRLTRSRWIRLQTGVGSASIAKRGSFPLNEPDEFFQHSKRASAEQPGLLGVIEQRHETEVHMQLLMAVEQGPSGIVGDKVDFRFLVSAEHDDIFD